MGQVASPPYKPIRRDMEREGSFEALQRQGEHHGVSPQAMAALLSWAVDRQPVVQPAGEPDPSAEAAEATRLMRGKAYQDVNDLKHQETVARVRQHWATDAQRRQGPRR